MCAFIQSAMLRTLNLLKEIDGSVKSTLSKYVHFGTYFGVTTGCGASIFCAYR